MSLLWLGDGPWALQHSPCIPSGVTPLCGTYHIPCSKAQPYALTHHPILMTHSTSGLPLHGPLAQCSPLLPPACGQAHSLSSALSLNGLLCVLLPSHGLNVFQRRVLVTCNVALLNSPCGFNTVSSFLIKKAKLFTQGAARSWDDQVGVRSD